MIYFILFMTNMGSSTSVPQIGDAQTRCVLILRTLPVGVKGYWLLFMLQAEMFYFNFKAYYLCAVLLGKE